MSYARLLRIVRQYGQPDSIAEPLLRLIPASEIARINSWADLISIAGAIGLPIPYSGAIFPFVAPRSNYVHPASRALYTRSGQIWLPDSSGVLQPFASDVIPRYWDAALGRWLYRVDPGRTQLLLHSNTLSNAAWGLTGLQAATQSALGPTGALNSWALVENTSAVTGTGGGQSISAVAGAAYTVLAIISARANSRFFQIVFTAGGFGANLAASFDPATGTVTTNSPSITGRSIPLANGNWLVSATATATATVASSVLFRLSPAQTTYFPSYTGDGVSGVNVWGINCSATSYAPPFVVSTSSAVTIGNPSWSVPVSQLGLDLSAGFTLYAEGVWQPGMAAGGLYPLASIDDGTGNNFVAIRNNAAQSLVYSQVQAAGVQQGVLNSPLVLGSLTKTALSYNAGSITTAMGGIIGASGAFSPAVGLNTLRVGTGLIFSAMCGGIGQIALIPRVLSDAELQGLTL